MSNSTLTTSIMSSTTSSAASATSSQNGNGNGGGGGPSSPLLFFVALGFGVVFTNLWIIVGVKYCFRYNQRNRARMTGEDPDAMDMAAMPRQRRRREKKLMTMDEVNERFPLIKYKTWRSTRAAEGLPTAGGIAEHSSRPASVKDVPIQSEIQEPTETNVINEKAGSSEQTTRENFPTDSTAETSTTRPETSTSSDHPDKSPTVEDEEDADRIQTAIPAEQLPDPGDMCAICIDALEDDDDIRGLSCGHAFHGSCLDPWLTSRRACCPLCKADYYVPKPRPEGEAEESRRRATEAEMLQAAGFTLTPGGRMRAGRRGRTLIIPSRFLQQYADSNGARQQQQFQQQRADRRRARTRAQQTNTTVNAPAPEVVDPEQQEPQTDNTGWRQRLSSIRMPSIPAISRTRNGRTTESGSQPTADTTTPAQLEEGRSTAGQ